MKKVAFLFLAALLSCKKENSKPPIISNSQPAQMMKIVVNTKFVTHDSIAYFLNDNDTSIGIYSPEELGYIDGFIKQPSQTFTRSVIHTFGNENLVQIDLNEAWNDGTYPFDSIHCNVYLNNNLVYSGAASHGSLVADIPY